MRLRDYLPFVSFIITTNLKPEEVQKRIFNNVQPAQQKIFSFRVVNNSTSPYEGWVGNDAFKIQRVINYRNDFNPVISGLIYANNNKTDIEIKMRLPTFAIVFGIVWLGIIGLVCLGILAVFFLHFNQILKSGFSPFFLGPFGMFLFGSALFTFPFRFEAKKSKKFLVELFE